MTHASEAEYLAGLRNKIRQEENAERRGTEQGPAGFQ